MLALTERQEAILGLIVRQYTDSAQPVGSNTLVDNYHLGVSSATIRNEMAALTEFGMLRQPHTSAGRVPTEDGYRYYVGRLLRDTDLPSDDKRMISHQFHQARADVDGWARLAATVLAQHSHVASVVTAARPDQAVFKHVELIATQGSQVLLVLVLQGGEVMQQMLALPETIEQAELSRMADEITRRNVGRSAEGLAGQAASQRGVSSQIIDLLATLMTRTNALKSGEIHRGGINNVLRQPEFAEASEATRALRLLEERSLLDQILERTFGMGSIGTVQVVIGGEGAFEDLDRISIVIARYGAPGLATGALGVFGPTRMAYGRSISTVRYVAELMSELVTESFAGGPSV